MIVIRLTGGLGNQMFQYAFACILHKKFHQNLYYYYDDGENITNRKFELNSFNISNTPLSKIEYQKFPKRKSQNIIHKIQGSNYTTHFEQNFNINQIRSNKNNLLIGYWQEHGMINLNKALVLSIFTPNLNLQNALNQFLQKEQIIFNNTVGIHIRLGDYLNNPTVNNIHGTLSLSYYRTAIEKIKREVINPKFFIFTDSPTKIEKYLHLENAQVIQSNNASIDLMLLSKCNHQIIANSTFSWWAAWLNTNKNKRIIAPKMWYQNPPKGFDIHKLIPETWEQL